MSAPKKEETNLLTTLNFAGEKVISLAKLKVKAKSESPLSDEDFYYALDMIFNMFFLTLDFGQSLSALNQLQSISDGVGGCVGLSAGCE